MLKIKLQELAKKLATEHKMPKADRYDLFLREFDNMVEVLGFVQDPNYCMDDFRGREMLFPKRWLTIGVLPADVEVSV
jgi:hypothetical protein